MPASLFYLLFFGAVLLAGALFIWVVSRTDQPRRSRQDVKKIEALEGLVDRIREIAYDHRDLDSALASIITDEIRNYERTKRKELE